MFQMAKLPPDSELTIMQANRVAMCTFGSKYFKSEDKNVTKHLLEKHSYEFVVLSPVGSAGLLNSDTAYYRGITNT